MSTTSELSFKIPSLARLGASEPAQLYFRGEPALLQKRRISIVGSRKMSVYSKNLILRLARALSDADFCVVSGAAIGCDIAAHEGAFPDTIAVFGNGLDQIYPAQNAAMIGKIYERSLALSEYEDGVSARGFQFLQRNRIVVALSEALIVAQAEPRSGSLQSARLAREMGVPVYVLPHRMDESAGTNDLLAKSQARLIADFGDFVTSLAPQMPQSTERAQDEVMEFLALNSDLQAAIERFGDKIYEYELEGRIEILGAKIVAK